MKALYIQSNQFSKLERDLAATRDDVSLLRLKVAEISVGVKGLKSKVDFVLEMIKSQEASNIAGRDTAV